MSDYTLEALYWKKEGKSDKIWGYVETTGGNLFAFWGKRQVVDKDDLTKTGQRPSLQFKKHTAISALEKLSRQKENKDYAHVPVQKVEKIAPGFTEFFDYALVTARMMGKVRTDDWDND